MIVEQSKQIIEEVGKAFIGKTDLVEKVLMTIYAGGHVLLEDCPGVGKTTLAMAFSKALGLQNKRIQFTPDTLPSDITGFTMYNRESNRFEYRDGAANCQLLLADEINRTSPKTQSALLEVMEEHTITVDGKTHALPTPFLCIATQNPLGSAGTQPLPPPPHPNNICTSWTFGNQLNPRSQDWDPSSFPLIRFSDLASSALILSEKPACF